MARAEAGGGFEMKAEPGGDTLDTGDSRPSQLLGLQMRGLDSSRENSGNSRELPLYNHNCRTDSNGGFGLGQQLQLQP
eukprot:scaffold158416_cov30-Prasinocladus_malaysianus.AAC.1